MFYSLTQTTDILNTAVLTGKSVSVPVQTLAVEADGSVTDVTNFTSCRSTEEGVLQVSVHFRVCLLSSVFSPCSFCLCSYTCGDSVFGNTVLVTTRCPWGDSLMVLAELEDVVQG